MATHRINKTTGTKRKYEAVTMQDDIDYERATKKRRINLLETNELGLSNENLLPSDIGSGILIATINSPRFSRNFCKSLKFAAMTGNETESLLVSTMLALRLVSRLLLPHVDDKVPCFAFLKMMKEEIKRIESPWLTKYETDLIVNNKRINIDELQPHPNTIPLSTLLIVTSTMLAESKFKHSPSKVQVEFHYALPIRTCYTLTISDKKPRHFGKALTIYWIPDAHGCPQRMVFTSDPRLASIIGVEESTPSIVAVEQWDMNDNLCDLLGEEVWDHISPVNNSDPIGDFFCVSDPQRFNSTLFHLPTRSLWNTLPAIPKSLSELFTFKDTPSFYYEHNLKMLRRVIYRVMIDFVYLPSKRAAVEKVYAESVERYNIERLYQRCTLLRMPLKSDSNEDETMSIQIGSDIYSVTETVVTKKSGPNLSEADLLKIQVTLDFPLLLGGDDFKALLCQAFGGTLSKPLMRSSRIPPKLGYYTYLHIDQELQSEGLSLFSDWPEQSPKAIVYSVWFDKSETGGVQDTIVMQVLQRENTEFFFHIQFIQTGIKSIKKLPLEVALQYFQYWCVYLQKNITMDNLEDEQISSNAPVNDLPNEILGRIISLSNPSPLCRIATKTETALIPKTYRYEWGNIKSRDLRPEEVYDSSSFSKSTFRLVSKQFCRAADDTVPCFAFLKMMKEEIKRVESPWLTKYETDLIMNNKRIDLNKPLPSPSLIPLHALRIVASTAYWEQNILDTREECDSDLKIIEGTLQVHYAIANRTFFTMQINDEESQFNRKKYSVQQHDAFDNNGYSKNCPCCTRTSWGHMMFTEDPELAKHLEIGTSTPTRTTYNRFCEVNRGSTPHANNVHTFTPHEGSVAFQPNSHYVRNASLWKTFPQLPACVLKLLTGVKHDKDQFKALCFMIDRIQLNLIYMPHKRAMLEQLYSATLERHNIQRLYDKVSILKRLFCPNEGGVMRVQTNFGEMNIYQDFYSIYEGNYYHLNYVVYQMQERIQLPVFLSHFDFMNMMNLMVGGPYEAMRLYRRYSSLPELNLDCDFGRQHCAGPNIKIHTEFNEESGKTKLYDVTLESTYRVVQIQVLRRDTDSEPVFYFSIHFEAFQLLSTRQCDKETAIELFEYWYGFLSQVENYIAPYHIQQSTEHNATLDQLYWVKC